MKKSERYIRATIAALTVGVVLVTLAYRLHPANQPDLLGERATADELTAPAR